jgi:hypothetical protein
MSYLERLPLAARPLAASAVGSLPGVRAER